MFSGGPHVFQNLGDGTYYHSGSLAIRQALAANTNITFKILFNDAVAMTGGQPVDGPLTVERVAHSVRAEGVERIALVSDEPERFRPSDLPPGTTISHRRHLDAIQRELREIPGVTVLIYAQACATEKRRRRKRGLLEDPKRYAVINDLVCEGCGDCSVESNCLSVVPRETPFGRKRQIDQSSCNKDFSCLNGFCPSFVTVEGAERRTAGEAAAGFPEARIAALPDPRLPDIGDTYDLLVTGVGGTGVVTVGALITMAAHLESRGASVLDFMGFSQKFGPVLSYIRIAPEPKKLNQVRIDHEQADALIGCDLVVSTSRKASTTYRRNHTRAVVNTTEMPTADFVLHRDANLDADGRIAAIRDVVGSERLSTLAANRVAVSFLGDTIYANVVMLGFAWQHGLIPVSRAALERAIELNAIKIPENLRAFGIGRLAAAEPAYVESLAHAPEDVRETLDQAVARRVAFLTEYQDTQLAHKYQALVERVHRAESSLDLPGTAALTEAVARAYFRLLAYKDEYEVARLHTATGFLEGLRSEFGPKARIRFHLAPPLLAGKPDARGRPPKREFGSWLVPLFRVLARMKRLRGTLFDPFGYTAERRMERRLVVEFEHQVDTLLADLDGANRDRAAAIVGLYLDIRGYGPVKQEAVTRVRAEVRSALESAGFDKAA